MTSNDTPGPKSPGLQPTQLKGHPFGRGRELGTGSVQSSEDKDKALVWSNEPWLLILFLSWL